MELKILNHSGLVDKLKGDKEIAHPLTNSLSLIPSFIILIKD